MSLVGKRGRTLFIGLKDTFIKLSARNLAKVKVKHNPRDFALNEFDRVYGSAFKNWPSIRLGLLCPHSYCAVVNSFADCDQVSDILLDIGAFDIGTAYREKLLEYESLKSNEQIFNSGSLSDSNIVNCQSDLQEEETDHLIRAKEEDQQNGDLLEGTDIHEFSSQLSEDDYVQPTKFKYRNADFEPEKFSEFYNTDTDFTVKLIDEEPFQFPEHWRIFFFPRGKFTEFPPPRCDPTGILNYYLMDGASILPPLALNAQKGENVGDMCASPGGKSLAILFGLQFGKLLCNDASYSRLLKLKTVLKSYLPSINDWNNRILVSRLDVSSWHQLDEFDKVLLDVPCTNDRLSVSKESNNIFKQSRFNERMKLPQLQTEMLCCSLKALKPNGSLVYSTCSLSTLQNDGVVHMALSKLHRESSMEFVVNNLSRTFYPFREFFRFSESCRYGQLVVPFLPLNYGPMYISKINRIK